MRSICLCISLVHTVLVDVCMCCDRAPTESARQHGGKKMKYGNSNGASLSSDAMRILDVLAIEHGGKLKGAWQAGFRWENK